MDENMYCSECSCKIPIQNYLFTDSFCEECYDIVQKHKKEKETMTTTNPNILTESQAAFLSGEIESALPGYHTHMSVANKIAVQERGAEKEYMIGIYKNTPFISFDCILTVDSLSAWNAVKDMCLTFAGHATMEVEEAKIEEQAHKLVLEEGMKDAMNANEEAEHVLFEADFSIDLSEANRLANMLPDYTKMDFTL